VDWDQARHRTVLALTLIAVFVVASVPQAAHASTPQADLGLTVVTVTDISIGSEGNPDWAGPYYQLNYQFSAPHSNTEVSDIWLGTGGSNCQPCSQVLGFTYPSNESASITFSLFDDQSCCGSGWKPVNINGGSNSVNINTLGAEQQGQCIQPWSSSCTYTIQTKGSGLARTAWISLTVTVMSALQYQTSLRAQAYAVYRTLATDLSDGVFAQTCYNDWETGQAQLNNELVPLIVTPFEFEFMPGEEVLQIFLHTLTFVGIPYIGQYITGATAFGQDNTAYSIGGVQISSLIDCGNLETMWGYAHGGQSSLDYYLAAASSSAYAELKDLNANNIPSVISDLQAEQGSIRSSQSALGQLVNSITPVANGNEYDPCYYNGVVSCQPIAQYLLNDLLDPISSMLSQDSSYESSTLAMLQKGASSLGIGGYPFPGDVGLSYSYSLSGAGGLPPHSYSITFSSGTLPPGLTFAPGNPATLSGKPSATGQFTFALKVGDGAQDFTSATYTVQIYPTLKITTASLPSATNGKAYSTTVYASGGIPECIWGATNLPPGLSIGYYSGVISGTPTKTGSYNVVVTVTDFYGYHVSKALGLTVNS